MSDKHCRPILVIVPFLAVSWFSCVWGVERPTTRARSCVTGECHTAYRAKKHLHGPVALGVCKFCHRPADIAHHTFKLAREGGELCSYCHWDQALKENVHQPLRDGECLACHDPHASDGLFLMPADKVSKVCDRCHGQLLKGKALLHDPAAAGECTVCHNAHSSDHDHLLNVELEELCFLCHEATRDELKKFDHVHGPVQKAGCGECHDPHGSNHAKILKKDVPELCYTCHEEIRTVVQNASHRHRVVSEKGGCLKCHAPHASTARFQLRSDPMTLCLSCHDKEIETEEGETLWMFKSQVDKRLFLHGPVAQRDCSSCHISHGSQHFRLLIEEYPSEFYAPFDVKNYRLCFTCHPERRVLTKETTTLTDFRNGSVNLHYLHVNKPKKGRTCRACHATHGSDRPKHIRETVTYGIWEIPIQFEKTATGGGCKPGCHNPRTYDRAVPVDYSVLAPLGGAKETDEAKAVKQPQTDSAEGERKKGKSPNDKK